MNTLKDIPNLVEIAEISMKRTGLGITEARKHFNSILKKLVGVCYVLLCLNEKEAKNITNDMLPEAHVMCEQLIKVDQSIPLPQLAQSYYYCLIAVLLTMDGYSEDAILAQSARGQMLINDGVLN